MKLRFCPNLSMLFTEAPFLERFGLAASAGFGAVEFLFPYEQGIDQISSELEEHGLTLVLFDVPPGDFENGEVGTLCSPERRDYFRWSFHTALEAADRLSCSRINVLFGNRNTDMDPAVQIACAVENLAWAAPLAAQAGLTLLLEPLNAGDNPTYFLRTSSAAVEVIETVAQPGLKLQYDIYHAQITEGNLIRTIERCFPHIGHIQIADVPGRNQPGTGEINYPAVLAKLEQLGYQGYIGLEYKPLGGTIDSLAWLPLQSRRFK